MEFVNYINSIVFAWLVLGIALIAPLYRWTEALVSKWVSYVTLGEHKPETFLARFYDKHLSVIPLIYQGHDRVAGMNAAVRVIVLFIIFVSTAHQTFDLHKSFGVAIVYSVFTPFAYVGAYLVPFIYIGALFWFVTFMARKFFPFKQHVEQALKDK